MVIMTLRPIISPPSFSFSEDWNLLLQKNCWPRELPNCISQLQALRTGERPAHCPNMIKDLLAADEVRRVLGPGKVSTLQLLIGPPTGLNLRNLLWHGYLPLSEFDEILPHMTTFALRLTQQLLSAFDAVDEVEGGAATTSAVAPASASTFTSASAPSSGAAGAHPGPT